MMMLKLITTAMMSSITWKTVEMEDMDLKGLRETSDAGPSGKFINFPWNTPALRHAE